MSLVLAGHDGTRFVEATPGEPLMTATGDANLVVEACMQYGVALALLYPRNLTARFFDLSSREAGEILQKLRNYGVRLAIVAEPGAAPFSSRFGELLAEERRGRWFGVFETRDAAITWLRDLR